MPKISEIIFFIEKFLTKVFRPTQLLLPFFICWSNVELYAYDNKIVVLAKLSKRLHYAKTGDSGQR